VTKKRNIILNSFLFLWYQYSVLFHFVRIWLTYHLLHKRSNSLSAIVSLITVLCVHVGGVEISASISSIRYNPFFPFFSRFSCTTEMPISRSDPEMIRSYRARYIQGCAVAQRSCLSVITRFNEWIYVVVPLIASWSSRDCTMAWCGIVILSFLFWHTPFSFWHFHPEL